LFLIAATVVVGAATGLAVRWWLVAPVRVESSSMEPTLRPGQRLAVRRLRPAERVIRGDVVLARSAELGRVVVKRAIGLPGERVELDRDGGVAVDGHPIAEPYAARPGPRPAHQPVAEPANMFAVPEGSLFLLGDNRAASSDSRTWRQPYLPEDAVLGKVVRLGRRSRDEMRGTRALEPGTSSART
jgi:signal peptidase I